MKKTLTLLLVAAALVLSVAYFSVPTRSGKADSSTAEAVLQKAKDRNFAGSVVVAGIMAAAEGDEAVMAILMFTQMQAASGIIEGALEDAKTLCGKQNTECLFALGYVNMTLALQGLPRSKDEEKKLLANYSAAYEKFLAKTAKEALGF